MVDREGIERWRQDPSMASVEAEELFQHTKELDVTDEATELVAFEDLGVYDAGDLT